MHEQAQVRLKKEEINKLGAEVFVVVAKNLFRTKVFKEKNLLLSASDGPFRNEKSLVFATALSDPGGRVSARYGVSRKAMRWGSWVENQPTWFVIDQSGILSYAAEPTFSTPTSYVTDVDQMLDALRKAAR